MASILKVEKRRLQALDSSKEFSRLETALLIDRYRFLDLLPCTDSELRSLGYRVSVCSPVYFICFLLELMILSLFV